MTPPRPAVKPMSFPRVVVGMGAALLTMVGLMIWLKHMADMLRREDGPFLEKPKTYVTDIDRSEDVHDAALKSVKGTFLKGLRGRDWELAASGVTADFRGRFPAPGSGREVPDALVRLEEYSGETLKTVEGAAFFATLKSHIGTWASIDRAVWRSYEFLLATGGTSAWVSAHFHLAGVTQGGGRAELTASIQAQVVTADGTAWKVRRFALAEGSRAEADFLPFADITDETGFHFNESEERRKLLQALIDDRGIVTIGGLTCADFNRDGHPDILAAAVNNDATIFLNDGRGGFVPQPRFVKSPDECGYGWLCVDLDNDGVEEMVGTQVLEYEPGKGRGQVYRRKGEGWELVPKAIEFPLRPGERGLLIQGIVPADIDRNGFLDLFFCVYSNQNSKLDRYNRIAAHDGADNYLFLNRGDLVFTEESDARGITGTQYTYVAAWFDFDGDGDLDLFEGNDFGPNHLWENDGQARFRDAKPHAFTDGSNYTMGVTIADFDNTGAWSMYISNMYSHAGNRIVPLIQGIGEEMRSLGLLLAQGNQLYEQVPQARAWTETGIARGVNWADWAWGCHWWDPDNDGDRDLFVTNGFTTHADPSAPDY